MVVASVSADPPHIKYYFPAKSRSAPRCGIFCEKLEMTLKEIFIFAVYAVEDLQNCLQEIMIKLQRTPRAQRLSDSHHSVSSVASFSVRVQKVAFFLAYAVFVVTFATAAEPYLPDDDNEVLETLPRALLAGWDELTALRRELAADRDNPELASTVAARYLKLGSVEGDPRFYGYARAAIEPWWEANLAPATILRLRAKLKEKEHRYDTALVDLALLLEQHPHDVQAWVETANIYRVQGKYDEALKACNTMSEHAGTTRTLLCRLPIQAVTGQAEAAYDSLAEILPTAKERWPSAVPWVLTMQAKIAWALGREQQAEQHFRNGLAEIPENTYLLRIYADFLLDRDREEEVLSLLREHVRDNGILLRAAIAAHRTGDVKLATEWQSQLESRFEELRLRGSAPHGRFESRYALELLDDPQRALTVALANWQKQKEARDTRNVLEAAIAAKDPVAAQPVLGFLTEHSTEDVVLQNLVKQLERLK